MIIEMNRRMCLGVGCKLYEVFQDFEKKTLHAEENFDSRLNEDFDGQSDAHARVESMGQFHAWQASHNPITNNVSYGNDVDLRHGLTDSLLAAFRQVSLQWHRDIVQLSAPSMAASSHKRFLSRDLMEASSLVKRPRMGFKLRVRRELWQWSAIELGLKQLFESHAESRNLNQRNALIVIARSRLELIVVMPIGSGKSLLFVVSSQLLGAQVTIVIVPLVALKQNLLQRCKK